VCVCVCFREPPAPPGPHNFTNTVVTPLGTVNEVGPLENWWATVVGTAVTGVMITSPLPPWPVDDNWLLDCDTPPMPMYKLDGYCESPVLYVEARPDDKPDMPGAVN